MSISSVTNQPAVTESTRGRSAVTSADGAEDFEGLMEQPTPQKLTSLEAYDEWGRRIATPSADNMEALTKSLSSMLKEAFSRAGLADNPPVDIKLENGEIKVFGRRSDLAEIEAALNSDPELKAEASKLAAVTETMYSFVKDGHLAFQREYAMTNGSSATVNKYGHLFNNSPRPPRETTISYGGGQVGVSCEGEAVTPDDFRNSSGWIEADSSGTGALTSMMESAFIGGLALRSQMNQRSL